MQTLVYVKITVKAKMLSTTWTCQSHPSDFIASCITREWTCQNMTCTVSAKWSREHSDIKFHEVCQFMVEKIRGTGIHLPKVAPAGTHNRSYTSFAFHLPPLCFQLLQKEAQEKGGDMIEQGVEKKRELNRIFDTLWGDHTLAPCNEGKCNLHQFWLLYDMHTEPQHLLHFFEGIPSSQGLQQPSPLVQAVVEHVP